MQFIMKLSQTTPFLLKIMSVVLSLILPLFLYPSSGIAAEKEVLIGVLAKRGMEYTLQKWQPTADYLSREISGYHFTIKPLGFDREKVNVNGSGIGLGHPVGCTGARIVVTLLHALKKRGLKTGMATLCGGGGMAWGHQVSQNL